MNISALTSCGRLEAWASLCYEALCLHATLNTCVHCHPFLGAQCAQLPRGPVVGGQQSLVCGTVRTAAAVLPCCCSSSRSATCCSSPVPALRPWQVAPHCFLRTQDVFRLPCSTHLWLFFTIGFQSETPKPSPCLLLYLLCPTGLCAHGLQQLPRQCGGGGARGQGGMPFGRAPAPPPCTWHWSLRRHCGRAAQGRYGSQRGGACLCACVQAYTVHDTREIWPAAGLCMHSCPKGTRCGLEVPAEARMEALAVGLS